MADIPTVDGMIIDKSPCLSVKQAAHPFGHTSLRLQDRIKLHVPKPIALAHFSRNTYFLTFSANLPPSLIPTLMLLIQPLDFIFYKILPVLNIMMTVDFLFLFKAAVLSIYLLLKPLSSNLLTLPSADKNNSCTV